MVRSTGGLPVRSLKGRDSPFLKIHKIYTKRSWARKPELLFVYLVYFFLKILTGKAQLKYS
jgi:hypothetical protein